MIQIRAFLAAGFAGVGMGLVASASPPTGFAPMRDWDELPRLHTDIVWGYATSYDRCGGNRDFSHFITCSPVECPAPPDCVEGQAVVCMEANGPGQITRLWAPLRACEGYITWRIYLDGQTTPIFNATLKEFYGYHTAYYDPFVPPFVQQTGGGGRLYFPIQFEASARVESNYRAGETGPLRNYYQVEYQLFPPGTPVTTFDGTVPPEQQADRDAVAQLLQNTGANPGGAGANSITLGATTVPAGQTLALADINTAGVIRELSIVPTAPADAQLETVRLRATWDGSASPAIDVPLQAFFETGRQRQPYNSLPLVVSQTTGWHSFWPMPFRHAARIELVNTGSGDFMFSEAAVKYDTQNVPIDMGYLRLDHRVYSASAGQQMTLVHTSGVGHMVGLQLYAADPLRSQWRILEGDDIVTVDGAALNGTGVEDIFDGGYYYQDIVNGQLVPQAPFEGPYTGVTRRDEANKVASQHRWFAANPIRFNSLLDYKLEAFIAGTYETVVWFYHLETGGPGDADEDGDVDSADFAVFSGCFTGPAGGGLSVLCHLMDLDFDNDVDLVDLHTFQPLFSVP